MAFHQVATKIYSILIDKHKLDLVIADIKNNHRQIKQIFVDVLNTIEN